MLEKTIEMLIKLGIELTLLFIVISFLVGLLQEYIPPARIKNILSGKHGKGYFVAGLLGAITPFCSCSTIPFLKGLLRVQAGFGTMMVFLFASPLLNPLVIGLFILTFGISVTLFYFAVAMGVAVLAGYVLERMQFDKYIKPEVYDTSSTACTASNETNLSKWLRVWQAAWQDFKVVLPYLVISVVLGSIIYGFVPTEFIRNITADKGLMAIPIAAVIGIPLYIRASVLIPISSVLVAKGMDMSVVMAFIIGSAGASLTEVILLRALFKKEMIMIFLIVVLGMAITAGYLHHYLF